MSAAELAAKEEEIKRLKDIILDCHKALLSCTESTTQFGKIQIFSKKRVLKALKTSDAVVTDHVADNVLAILDNLKTNKVSSRLNA